MFFVSWVLWEQMTFVLGTAILLVFVIGYVKLLWVNRLVKKQEVVDEEKRMRIETLRSSGQIVESHKSHDIPFGVRAIQSGIQVDGIWISQANTPATSQLGLGGTSPDMLPTPDSRSGASIDLRPLPRNALQQNPSDASRKLDNAMVMADGPDGRDSYKPRKASHLRYGSHGEFDQTTLQQLEGNSALNKTQTTRPRQSSSRHAEVEAESSAADNELSSGVSSHSDVSLSQNMHTALEIQNEQISSLHVGKGEEFGRSPQAIHSFRAEYFSIPVDSPDSESANPFQTPLPSPNTQGYALAAQNNPQDINRDQASTQSPFVAGELHINKSVRKVNSGFEVLPAGTFGVPTELKGKGIESANMDFEGDSGERRQSTKLQKKPRTSMIEKRTSTTVDRS